MRVKALVLLFVATVEVAISVEDVGHGLPKGLGEVLGSDSRVVKLDSFRAMSDQGLGLAMSAAIVKTHGGRISWRSEPLAGAEPRASTPHRVRFTFTLPLAQRPLAQTRDSEHA